jgi:hypothetical protein
MCVGPSFCACGSSVKESPGIDHFIELAKADEKIPMSMNDKTIFKVFFIFLLLNKRLR